jgi:hypothetical protein
VIDNEEKIKLQQREMEIARLNRELAKPKMGVVLSKAEVIFAGKPGETKTLEWQIQN